MVFFFPGLRTGVPRTDWRLFERSSRAAKGFSVPKNSTKVSSGVFFVA